MNVTRSNSAPDLTSTTSTTQANHKQQHTKHCNAYRRARLLRHFVLDVHDLVAAFECATSDKPPAWQNEQVVHTHHVLQRLADALLTHKQTTTTSGVQFGRSMTLCRALRNQLRDARQQLAQQQMRGKHDGKQFAKEIERLKHMLAVSTSECVEWRARCGRLCDAIEVECDRMALDAQQIQGNVVIDRRIAVSTASQQPNEFVAKMQKQHAAERKNWRVVGTELREQVKQLNDELETTKRKLKDAETMAQKEKRRAETLRAQNEQLAQKLEAEHRKNERYANVRCEQKTTGAVELTKKLAAVQRTIEESTRSTQLPRATVSNPDQDLSETDDSCSLDSEGMEGISAPDGSLLVQPAVVSGTQPHAAHDAENPTSYGLVEKRDLSSTVQKLVTNIRNLVLEDRVLFSDSPQKFDEFNASLHAFQQKVHSLLSTQEAETPSMVSTPVTTSDDDEPITEMIKPPPPTKL